MKYIKCIIIHCCLVLLALGPLPDYKKIFGRDYANAELFLTNHRERITAQLRQYRADPNILVAVVFPELIRFSHLRDTMETGGLKVFYVNLGKEYADFSIGRFQMKPAFVELLEKKVRRLKKVPPWMRSIYIYSEKNAKDRRFERVRRLEDLSWQIKYLACFYHLVKKRFYKKLGIMTRQEQVLFFATAYNGGFSRSYASIKSWEKKKVFPYGTSWAYRNRKQYSYGSVALYYFQSLQNRVNKLSKNFHRENK